nr:unnamed protein product [Callosobruchus chinensis]
MFGFPSDPILRQKWIAAVPRENFTPVSSSKRRAIRLIGDPALTCLLQPLSHRRAVDDLSLFYRITNDPHILVLDEEIDPPLVNQ